MDRKKIMGGILPTNAYGSYFRLVEIEDADFIVSLRNDEKRSRYISSTSSQIEDQIAWLEKYKIRESKGEEFYIMCLADDKKTKLGVNRIYDISGDVCEYGSWLYSPTAGPNVAVLGDLYTKSLIYEKLGIKICKMSTMKDNTSVMRYTKSYNPTFVGEDDLSCHFELEYDDWNARRQKLLKIFSLSGLNLNQ